MNLPEKFLIRMKERLGSDFPAFLATYGTPPRRGLRVNTLKISAEGFRARAPFPLGARIGEDGFLIGEERAGSDPYHRAGLYYLQEPSAMAVGGKAAEFAGERVLDLCAAPGGKATLLAARMKGRGILVANETDAARARVLAGNIERMGVKNCAVTNADPERLAATLPAWFDTVLVDAPCSGEGMFKKEPNAVPEWSEENVARCAARQRKILSAAACLTAAGGVLVYSTCTFAEEEDEWQVRDFLGAHPAFTLLYERKLYPHETEGEGHFVAVLRKEGGETGRAKPYPVRRNAAAERAFASFCDGFFPSPPAGALTALPDGRLFLVPSAAPDLSPLRVLSLGTEVGEFDGKRFKPSHALAMAYGADALRRVTLTREESLAYLRGEPVGARTPNGWCTVCVEEFPLGLGKCVEGTVKNHLPKGLRL